MGIFRHFPYTNFHELNLDWFLDQFKELTHDWDYYNELWSAWKTDITNDFNEVSNEFKDLEEYIHYILGDTAFEDYIYQWLEEHPEATTTVQDHAITLHKLAYSLYPMGNVVVLSDSYGDSTQHEESVTSFLTMLRNTFTNRKEKITTSFIRGASFTSTTKFLTVLQNAYDQENEDFNNNVDRIFVVGCINDRGTNLSNLRTAITTFKNDAKQKYPKLKNIYICLVGMAIEDLTLANNFSYQQVLNLNDYYNTLSKEGLIELVPNGYSVMRKNDYFVTDYLHPSTAGNREIYKYVIGAIDGVGYEVSRNPMQPFKLVASLQDCIIQQPEFNTYQSGSHTILQMANTKTFINFMNSEALFNNALLNGAIEHEVAGWESNALLQTMATVDIKIPCIFTFRVNNVYTEASGFLKFTNKKVYMVAHKFNDAGTGFVTINNCDRITVIPLANPIIDTLNLKG